MLRKTTLQPVVLMIVACASPLFLGTIARADDDLTIRVKKLEEKVKKLETALDHAQKALETTQKSLDAQIAKTKGFVMSQGHAVMVTDGGDYQLLLTPRGELVIRKIVNGRNIQKAIATIP
jgi:tetrahydromethanopterin S-methyltransferase subunit B